MSKLKHEYEKTSDGKSEVLKFLDDFSTTDLPDHNKEPELYKLVRKNQLHRHTFTCRKGNNNRFEFKRCLEDILNNEESV